MNFAIRKKTLRIPFGVAQNSHFPNQKSAPRELSIYLSQGAKSTKSDLLSPNIWTYLDLPKSKKADL